MAVAEVKNRTAATTPDGYTSWDDYYADLDELVAWRDDEDANRIGKAMRLAPSLEVFRALLIGQPVPVSALDTQWAKRYGIV